MKPSISFIVLLCSLAFVTEKIMAQQLSDEVQSMLSESDQKKIAKADETFTKGDLILSKASYPGDDNLVSTSDPDSKLNKKYFTKRIEATDYYRIANSSKLAVYDKNIKDFWKKFKGDHQILENVKRAEIKANMQFQEAQQNRKDASRNPKLKDWVPLIVKAENNEKQALIQLQKVLFVYLSYPAQYNQAWFDDSDTQKTSTEIKPEANPEIAVSIPVEKTNKTEEPTASKPDTVSSVNIQPALTASEVLNSDNATEVSKGPDVSRKEVAVSTSTTEKSVNTKSANPSKVIPQKESIESTRKEVPSEPKASPKPIAKANEEFISTSEQSGQIRFHVQIAASHNQLSSAVLNGIYNGDAEIITISEDGWYKYSVIAGNTLEDALELLKSIDVPGAFVVAYSNNRKMDLRSAIRLTR